MRTEKEAVAPWRHFGSGGIELRTIASTEDCTLVVRRLHGDPKRSVHGSPRHSGVLLLVVQRCESAERERHGEGDSMPRRE